MIEYLWYIIPVGMIVFILYHFYFIRGETMFTIHKQVLLLGDEQIVKMPAGSTILSCGTQGENICIWYKCDARAKLQERKIYIHGTGHPMVNPDAKFIGTVHLGLHLVFHVFIE